MISVATARASSAEPEASPASPESERSPTDWDKVKLQDETPLCVFASHGERGDALTIENVHKQTLRANARVVFGTFSPGCISETCDAVPTHQCWVDHEQPNTLVVHSRLTFEHRRGTVCTDACSPIVAGCETDLLKAGKYTVRYGERTFGLQVPGVVRQPCFAL